MADQGNHILSVDLSANTFDYKTKKLYQYDHGMKLRLKGIRLSSIQVHFSNEHIKNAISLIYEQDENGDLTGDIPDIQLAKDGAILAYVYYEDETSGYTVKRIFIPVEPRTKPEHITLNSPSLGPVNELASQLQNQIDRVENLGNSGGSTGPSDGAETDESGVYSINGKTGKHIVLDAKDVGALYLDSVSETSEGDGQTPINATTLSGMTYDQIKERIIEEVLIQVRAILES